MSKKEDDHLLSEINALAEQAEQNKPLLANISALATMLHEHFPHRSSKDIQEQMQVVWLDRGLFWE